MNAEDRDLMLRIAGKDEEALKLLYGRYGAVVYGLCRRIIGRDHDAEEVVAEVFWELWQKAARYCPSKSSPFTYLIMITRCRALDRKRGLTTRAKHPILDWINDSQHAGGAAAISPAEQALADEQRASIARAVSQLDADQRRAIELAFFDGLSHTAVAEKLELPLGTIKGRIRAALERLRGILNFVQE